MNKQKIYVSAVNAIRSGEKNGRKWVLYAVLDQAGTKYSSFDSKYQGMIGQEIEVMVEERIVEKNGRTYKNLSIIEPKKENEAVNSLNASTGFVLAELKAIKQYVKEIHSMLLEVEPPDGEPEATDLGKGDEVNPPDIPF